MSQKQSNHTICSRCVMDLSDPYITFNQEGVCNYCLFSESQENNRRMQKLELPWVINEIRKNGKDKKYDVLIGLSGGVDSSYALHKVLEQGLRPLCFSVDNGWQTKEADENIMRMVEGLKVPFYRYTINLEAFRGLQRAFIMAGVKNIEVISDHILFATTQEMADKYNIKTVISGGNWQTEGTMPVSWGEDARDLYWIKSVYKRVTGKKLKGLPTISLVKEQYLRLIRKIKKVNLLDFYTYDREHSIATLSRLYGYKIYGAKHNESVFTQWFQEYYLPEKFGIDKRKAHLSSMIHSGLMTREDAINELELPLQGYKFNDMISGMLEIDAENIKNIPIHKYEDFPNSKKIRELVVKLYAIAKR